MIGFETQVHEHQVVVSGIQRVVRETHVWVTDFLGYAGVGVGWVNTAPLPRSYAFKTNPYLASDPLLNGPEVKLSEVEVLVIIDIATLLDIRAIQREKNQRNLRVVAVIHDIMSITHPAWFPAGAGTSFRIYLQKILHIADDIIVMSQFVRDEILRLKWSFDAPIHVIGLGSVHLQRPPSTVPDSEISLLYVSTVEPRKGHQRILGAFDELRGKGKDVSLHLVGKRGWAGQELYDSIQGHPEFGARIVWHQDATDEKVLTLACQSNIGVFPSDEEGFGLFFEEALTLGLKVVASDIPVFREREQPNVFFAPLTAQGFAETITEAADTPWASFADSKVRSMRDFSYDVSVLLLEITNSKRNPATVT
jgi:glycosyltransferase involved in cell wall biosynthesis